MSLGVASAVHDDGVLFVDLHLTGMAQLVHAGVLQLQAKLVRNHLAAGQNGDILQHFLAAIAKARSLDSNAS